MSALVASPRQKPAHERLAPELRARVEAAVEHLIALLDAIDGDPDLEPSFGYLPDGAGSDDCEINVDDEPDLGSPETHHDQRRWGQGRAGSRELDHDEVSCVALDWRECDARRTARREAEGMAGRARPWLADV